MRKRIIVIIVLLLGIGFLVEKELFRNKRDDNHAILTIEVRGKERKIYSENGIDSNEKMFKNKKKILLKEGETANFTFKCDECGYSKEESISSPGLVIIKCDCKGTKQEKVCVLVEKEE